MAPAVVPISLFKLGRAFAGAKIVETIQVPLADVNRAVSMLLKMVPDGLDVLPQCQVVRPGAGVVGVDAREQAGSGGRAHRSAGIGPGEQNAPLGESIQVGRVHPVIPVATDRLHRLLVGHDYQQVWLASFCEHLSSENRSLLRLRSRERSGSPLTRHLLCALS